MSLHPQAKAVLEMMAANPGKSFEEMTLEDIRDMRAAMPNGFGLAGPPEDVARVENRTIPGPSGVVPIRVYWPVTGDRLPVLFYFHGGGFVFGHPDWVDEPCRTLANQSGAIVISVDYRLAPEHRYPAAAEDCFAAVAYVAGHAAEFDADPDRIAVSGDSAGGNMAAVVALMARDRKGPAIALQILIYPCVDYLDRSPSMREFGEGYFLSHSAVDWFWKQYAGEEHACEPYLSPQHSPDLAGLPQAVVITAACDPLRDQGEIYAEKLQAAGVAACVKRFDGMIHGFLHMGAVIDGGKDALQYAGSAAARVLRTGKA
jgi:acetyl esterase